MKDELQKARTAADVLAGAVVNLVERVRPLVIDNEVLREPVARIEGLLAGIGDRCWLLWSKPSRGWFGQIGSGITTDIARAGRYTYADAQQHCDVGRGGTFMVVAP